MAEDSCSSNCRFFWFTDPAPPYGHGSNWFCNFHNKRIRDATKKCSDWRDMYKQTTKKREGESQIGAKR